MSVYFLGIEDKSNFVKQYKNIYRYVSIDHLLKILAKNKFSFVNPMKWKDPYEKYFLERPYILKNREISLPIKGKTFACCFSGTSNSEAYWSVYTPNSDGVRIEFNTQVFLEEFLEKIQNVDIFIGPVKYFNTKEFPTANINILKLINSIERKSDLISQVELLYRKRVAFEYEDEIRIIVLPKVFRKDSEEVNYSIDLIKYISNITFDPRFGMEHFKLVKKVFMSKYRIRVSKASLYRDIKLKPFKLSSI
jgi:hypothetical protein